MSSTTTQGPFATAEQAWNAARAAEKAGCEAFNFTQDEFGFWFDTSREG